MSSLSVMLYAHSTRLSLHRAWVVLQVPEFDQNTQPKPDFQSYLNKVRELSSFCCIDHVDCNFTMHLAMAVMLLPPHTWDS